MLRKLSHSKTSPEIYSPLCDASNAEISARDASNAGTTVCDASGAQTPIRDARFPAPFKEGLEYSSPARGTWNIVHTGMLIPESHQIFVCAQGCLRGVVLTAAEMNAMERYSAISIREENVLDGTMEELMIEGVTDVISKLKYRPRAILLFISCQHFFLAYDQKLVFQTLEERFPDIRFVDCYMIPTLRKSGITPDQKMRIQMYRMLEPAEKNARKVNLIGSNHAVGEKSELLGLIKEKGFEVQALNWCRTFDDYLAMAEAPLNILYEPIAMEAAKDMKKRLGQSYLYLPCVFDYDELDANYHRLLRTLMEVKYGRAGSGMEAQNFQEAPGKVRQGMPEAPGKARQETMETFPMHIDLKELRERAEAALLSAKDLIRNTPVAVDYTFTFRILSFTRMLLEHGFHVTEIYADVFLKEEEEDFRWIKENFPEIIVSATNRPKMRCLSREREEKILAIGQKAAYFAGTDYFVNVVEGGGLYGYEGIVQIAELMRDAFQNKKDRKQIIQRKGYGCESCI